MENYWDMAYQKIIHIGTDSGGKGGNASASTSAPYSHDLNG